MKKIIASAVIAAATLSASQAAVFNGASAGLTMGTNTTTFKDKDVDGTTTNHKTIGLYGIHFAYDFSKANSVYFGLGLDVLSGFTKMKFKEDEGKFTVKYRVSSELDAKLGYNICNQTVLYGLVGGKVYNYASKDSDGDKSSDTHFAPVIGLGAATKVSEKISAGLEYRYSFDRTTKDEDSKFKMRSHAVLAKVSYHF